jgi:ATP-dependent Clp protease ATP-binding subunit ClpC
MGQIYKDIAENTEEEDLKTMANNLMSVCEVYEGQENIKFREKEIERISSIMNKSLYRSVLLVGDKGIGKLSIVEAYIDKLEKEYSSAHVLTLDYNKIVDKATNQSEFEKIIDDSLYIATNNESFNVILNINNFGHYLERDCYGTGGFSFFNGLAEAIGDGLRIIATTTTNEYKTIEDDFPFILDYFTVIKVPELTKEQSKEILSDTIQYFETDFNISLPESTCDIICNNADKYIKDTPFPEKAIRLIDEVSANIVGKKSDNSKIGELVEKSNKLKLELGDLFEKGEYEKCNEINDKITLLEARIEKLNGARDRIVADESDVLESVGNIVGVKMSRVSNDQTAFLKEMPVEIKKKVIGQDETVDKITKNISRNMLGLRKSAHSAGNFIFIGSTGVGKTYLAKQLASYLYGSEENMLRFDMSEYQSEIDVSKLLGSAPGYVGYKESGLLVKRLAKYPESVVLFDEIEKAHPKIYDVLLQLLDEGFVTGSDGNKVDATKALIIFTSNIGVKNAKEMASPLGYSKDFGADKAKRKEELIRKALKRRFSPEFLNRLDSICYFNSLDRNSLKTILYNEMGEMNENIKTICGKTVELTEDVENWLLDKVEKEDNGARPIIRLLQQEIEEELTTMIVNDDELLKTDNASLKATIENDKIVLK